LSRNSSARLILPMMTAPWSSSCAATGRGGKELQPDEDERKAGYSLGEEEDEQCSRVSEGFLWEHGINLSQRSRNAHPPSARLVSGRWDHGQ
jgi:hypothetical protein